jgi:hypothetical protein
MTSILRCQHYKRRLAAAAFPAALGLDNFYLPRRL